LQRGVRPHPWFSLRRFASSWWDTLNAELACLCVSDHLRPSIRGAGTRARATGFRSPQPPTLRWLTWHRAGNLAVALLGLVAISYSLSAELSLWASKRSDRVAERAATSNVAMNVRDKYQRAKFELDGLSAARSTLGTFVAARCKAGSHAASYRSLSGGCSPGITTNSNELVGAG
jgi:hypothetical protein